LEGGGPGPLARLILVEAALELVPKELWDELDVKRSSARYGVPPGHMLLDKSLHYRAMRRLPGKWRRGRPDILHVSLLNAMDSPLVRKGLVDVYFHTVEGRVFRVRGDTRIPKSYERFRGLMSQLLREGRVPPGGDPLIYELNVRLDRLIGDSPRILLWERGRSIGLESLVDRVLGSRGVWIIIGAFPRGDFPSHIFRLAGEDERVSLYRGLPVKAWTVVSRILCGLESALGLL